MGRISLLDMEGDQQKKNGLDNKYNMGSRVRFKTKKLIRKGVRLNYGYAANAGINAEDSHIYKINGNYLLIYAEATTSYNLAKLKHSLIGSNIKASNC